MNIYIEKNILFNKDMSDNAICVYAALRYFCKNDLSEYYVNVNHVAYILLERDAVRREMELIRDGLKTLEKLGLIKTVKKRTSFDFIMDLSKINYDIDKDGYYVVLYLSELRKIMNIKNISKGTILKYFITICSRFDNSKNIDEKYRNKFVKISLESLAKLSCIPYRTCIRYTKLLEDNKIIFPHRLKSTPSMSIESKDDLVNVYCRYENKKICEKYFSDNFNLFSKTSSNYNANTYRSLAQKYNALCRGKNYDLDTIKAIYNYCVSWNEYQQKIYDAEILKGFSPTLKQRDLSIFRRFNL